MNFEYHITLFQYFVTYMVAYGFLETYLSSRLLIGKIGLALN